MGFLGKGQVRKKLGKINRQFTAHYINTILESGMDPELPKSLVPLLLANGIAGC